MQTQQVYPLTHPQQRIWYTEKLHPGTGMWNNAGSLKMRGRLDFVLLAEAVNRYIASHPNIRLRVTERDGQPVQYVAPYRPYPVERLDFSALGKQGLYDWDSQQNTAPMPLMDCDLFYFAIFQTGEGEGGIYAKVHHIICDGLSMIGLTNEIMQIYQALLEGTEPVIAPGPDYRSFIDQEAAYLASPRAQRDLAYWQRALDPPPEPTHMKVVKSKETSVRARRKICVLTARVSEQIRAYCQRAELSPFCLFLSVLALYIHRVTGKEDMVITAPVVNRTGAHAEKAFGMYVSTVPVRLQVDDTLPFAQFAQQVAERWYAALKHQRYPYDLLMQRLRERYPGFEGLDNVSLSFQNGRFVRDQGAFSYEGRWHFSGYQANALSIHLSDRENTGRFIIDYDYQTPLFSAKEIDYIHEHLLNLLTHALGHDATPICDLNPLPEEEWERVLYRFNQTDRSYPAGGTLAQLWRDSCQGVPGEQPAVLCGGRVLSYRQLDEASNAFARRLTDLGVGPEQTVAVITRRTLAYPVSALSVIKSGGAFMPIDPELPLERIGFILKNSRAKAVMVSPEVAGAFGEAQIPVVVVDPDDLPADSQPVRMDKSTDALSYVIYTSGSTGQPKGVQIPERAICHFVHSLSEIWDLSPGVRMLGAASIGFDISVMELVLSLMRGGTLVLAQERELELPGLLVRLIEQNQVNVLVVTPGRMELLLSDPRGAGCLRGFREIGMGGDVLSDQLLARVQQSTSARIINFYGPTEITICCTCTDVTHAKSANIGSPMPDVKAYILDRYQHPVPIGVPGELYIGGAGLARGYLNQPELTGERFVDNPFLPGERLYRTGDLARWYPLGEIAFLGRIDQQVKIRGFRIELGEIENHLLRLDGVTAAAVTDRTDEQGRKYLCAYLCLNKPATKNAIKRQLSQELPAYMIPAYFVRMDQLPLNHSGKVNRHLLPDPADAPGLLAEGDYEPPATATEVRLAQLWQEQLGVAQIGRGDDFFEIGGDSLSIVRVLAQVQRQFRVELPLDAVYRATSLTDFAALIDGAEQRFYQPITPGPARRRAAAASAQQRMWVLSQSYPESLAYHVPLAFAFPGRLDIPRLEAAFTQLAKRHEALRTHFELQGGSLTQVIDRRPQVRIDQLASDGACLRRALKGLMSPMDLTCAPIMRLAVVHLPEQDVLFWDLHHIICDARSLSVLLMDLKDLYAGNRLPPKSIAYPDYARWQQELLRSEAMQRQKRYWGEQLAGELPLLNLFTDRPRGARPTFAGARRSFTIDAAHTHLLREFAAQRHGTLFMALMALYNVFLYRYTGQEDLIVGTPVAGRARPELQDVVGVCINTLPIRTQLDGAISFAALFDRVRDTCIAAMEHGDYPIERMIADVNPERSGRNPLFDTMLVLGPAQTDLTLGELRGKPLQMDPGVAKLDLTLEVYDQGDHLQCVLEYNTHLFHAATIRRMAGHLQRLAELTLAEPLDRIADLPMLSQAEFDQLTQGFNQTDAPVDFGASVPGILERVARDQGEREALVVAGERYTFAQLNARANAIAWALKAAGVGRGTLVALCARRSLDMVAGLFGILKASAGYLPLDPSYPADRVSFMLRDSGATVLLTDGSGSLGAFAGKVLRLGEIGEQGAGENPVDLAGAEDPCYVIYTSGSTGVPKGAILPRRAMRNLYEDVRQSIGYPQWMKSVSVTTVSFDIFVVDCLLPLLYGCAVALCTEEELRQPPLLAALIEREDVGFIQTTPTRMRLLMEDASFRRAAGAYIRKMVLGGEEYPLSLLKLLKRYLPKATLISGYGPTETTVYCTFKDLTHTNHITIGRSMINTRMYILDAYRHPTPIGVLGEAYISGACVATGYINRPQLNAEKFLPDPFRPGNVMYQSGDVCCYREDGEMEIRGRVDHQVKIRGLRIELGEIEAALRRVKGVEAALVRDLDQGPNKYLCAYYVAERPIDQSELRASLGAGLPAYMVPAYFVHLTAFPLTANGKVNRRALPDPKLTEQPSAKPAGKVAYTPWERRMARIWKKVLAVDQVLPEDSFFDLGGDSLAVIKVQAALMPLGVALRTQDFYDRRTLRALCASLERQRAEPQGRDPLAAWKDRPVADDPALTPASMGHVLLTGATGYLGAHVLDELAGRPGCRVACLVRGRDRAEAQRRLDETLDFYFPGQGARFAGRIYAVPGDVTRPRLTDEALPGVDTVIHCAAITDHVGDAALFERVNTQGTAHVIAWAKRAGAQLLHVSTVSVSGVGYRGQPERSGVFTERDCYVGQEDGGNPYVHSKLLAETLVLGAAQKGLPARIFRVGVLTGRHSDGGFQRRPEKNAFANRLLAMIHLGLAPESIREHLLEMTPVDACARALVALASLPGLHQRVFHLCNPQQLSVAELARMLTQLGRPVRFAPDAVFRREALSRVSERDLPGVMEQLGSADVGGKIRLSTQGTEPWLRRAGCAIPPADAPYLARLLDGLERSR